MQCLTLYAIIGYINNMYDIVMEVSVFLIAMCV